MTRPRAGPEALTRALLTGSGARRTSVRTATERLIAVGYGLTYDAVVSGFPPYERLLEEITTLVARSAPAAVTSDRKSTRLNSSHSSISYAVFCLKKKKNTK